MTAQNADPCWLYWSCHSRPRTQLGMGRNRGECEEFWREWGGVIIMRIVRGFRCLSKRGRLWWRAGRWWHHHCCSTAGSRMKTLVNTCVCIQRARVGVSFLKASDRKGGSMRGESWRLSRQWRRGNPTSMEGFWRQGCSIPRCLQPSIHGNQVHDVLIFAPPKISKEGCPLSHNRWTRSDSCSKMEG